MGLCVFPVLGDEHTSPIQVKLMNHEWVLSGHGEDGAGFHLF